MDAKYRERLWEERITDLWAHVDEHDPRELIARVGLLNAELTPGDARADFELASAFDFAGESEQAARLYRSALSAGLADDRRRQAVIQLASTLRNLGQPRESAELLASELKVASDELDDAVAAFLSLALLDCGRPKEAVSTALRALSRHLPKYRRSVSNYARDLSDTTA